MSYLGSPPASQFFAPGTDTFSGTGSQTAFTLSRNVGTVNDILVIVNNVEQQPSNYTVSNNILTFSPAPSAGTNNIYVRYLSTNLVTIAPQQGSVFPSSLSTPNALYWDTSGNVGVGTTSPGAYKLNVNGASVNIGATGTGNPSLQAVTTDAAGISYLALQNGTRNYSIRDEGTAGALTFRDDTAVAERMRIDSAGNVGIGTTTPQVQFQQYLPSGTTYRYITNGTVNIVEYASTAVAACAYGTSSNHPLLLSTNNLERMRIDTSGNLLVNTTNNQPGGASYPGQISIVSAGGSTKTGINISTTSSSASKMIEFQYTGFGVAGVITTTISSTAYTTSSDYRLKENVQPMVGALQKIAQLKPCSYTWKFDGSASEGFIAHELAEICPNAVVGMKDEVDKNGKPIYQGIDTSFLVATLTAAIQEQQAMIEELKTKVAALEAR